MARKQQGLAVVTGASSGIGYELARVCAQEGFELLVVAHEPQIEAAMDYGALNALMGAR